MPRDQRLYMTFPIDFDEHPKVEGLSDSAFRAFVSMNGYSRRHGLDGRVPASTARRRWKPRALAELVASHPERPLVLLDGDTYVIRDYAEHQLTNADIEDLRKKRSDAGAKGGRARMRNQANASTDPKQMLEQTASTIQAESESEIERPRLNESSREVDAHDGRDSIDALKQRAKLLGIRDLAGLRDSIATAVGEPVAMSGAYEVALTIVTKSPRPVKNVDAYVTTACRDTPFEVQKAYFEMGGAA